MNNKELLPCPFCGGEAKLWRTEDSFDSNGWYTEVICQHCNARTTGNEDEAINAWNTRNYLEKQDSSKELMEFVKFCRNASVKDIRQIHDRARDLIANYKECCEKSCKEENATLPSWTYFEWNHQFNFSVCTISISQSVCLDFTVRRANNDLNTDKWEAYSELVNCVHDTQLSEEQIIFGVSRKEAIEKCNDAIKQISNGFLELYNKNIKE